MRIVVTGAVGFIGSWLCERLIADERDVVGVDDFSTGRHENVGCLLNGDSRMRMYCHDAGDKLMMEPIIAEADFVFHLAATVGVFQYMQASVTTVRNNVNTSDTVFGLCNRYRVPVLFTSTSEVYGKSADVPFREDADIVLGPSERARWGYAASKLTDEFLALAYHRQYGLPVRIVRLFNCVGPRQTGRYGMVVPRFVSQAKAGQPMTVFGDGNQTRCFCSVHDIVDGLIAIAGCGAAVGRVVNLGTDEEVSINELAEEVAFYVNPHGGIVHVSYSEAYGEGFEDMTRRVPDITRARELIGWKPRLSLADILVEMANERNTSCKGAASSAVSSATPPSPTSLPCSTK